MSYTLNHTAEQIDHKLNLISENKNLLPYPYQTALPEGLEDVGDGSILTTANTIAAQNILLNTFTLPAGKYMVSLDITDLLEAPVISPYFSLSVRSAGTLLGGSGDTGPSTSVFELDTEAVVEVSFHIAERSGSGTFSDINFANLLVKPQIEAGIEKTAWVPYMDKIGNYVDERFNGINAKLKPILELMDCIEIEN